jgi:ribonuclease D
MSGQNNNTLNPTLIYTHRGLMGLIKDLRHHSLIAVDTESDSLYSYYPKVCLIQLTVFADPKNPDPDQVVDYLVDPLRLDSIEPLGALLASPKIQVVMHAAENDILTMQRDFQFQFANIFDTQLAARILGWKGIGLAAILEREFGVHSNKRMQRTNWGTRPLTPQQIAYAQMDTRYLPKLRTIQMAELTRTDRLEEAAEAFQFLAELDYADRPVNERTVWQMKNIRKVPREDRGVLEALWQWRENEAQRRNCPPFRVANDAVLVRLASVRPTDRNSLPEIEGLSSNQVKRYGDQLLAAIDGGSKRPVPRMPESNHRRPPQLQGIAQVRYEALRRWRSNIAEERGVNDDIVFSNSVLMTIAQNTPQSVEELEDIPGIGPWKAKTYAPGILPLMNGRIDSGQT